MILTRPRFDSLLAMNFHGTNGETTRLSDHDSELFGLIIGALVVVAVFGYQLYRERHNMTGIGINAGWRDISIQKK